MINDISILAHDISYYNSLVLFPYNENVSHVIVNFGTDLQSIQTNLGLSLIVDDSIYYNYKFSINVSDNSVIKDLNILSVFITYNNIEVTRSIDCITFFCKWSPTIISNSIHFEAYWMDDLSTHLIIPNINLNILYKNT